METIQQQQQWRDQQQEEEQSDQDQDQDQLERAAKAPRLLFEEKERSSPPNLALCTHDPAESYNKATAAAAAIATSQSPGRLFSVSQWQELELQALIYKYMVAGVPVPHELILPIKRSLLNAYHHSQQYLHFQSAMLHASYWGRYAMDPEPDRCRRTDGKKWRCSKEVVVGHKYCERHMHRGRNRSRKLVEVAAPTTSAAATAGANGSKAAAAIPPLPLNPRKEDSCFSLAPSQPLPHLSNYNRPPAAEWCVSTKMKSYRHHPDFSQEGLPDDKSSGCRVLRPFFDDWPRTSDREPPNSSSPSPVASPSQLSISIPGEHQHHHHSDFSLKLSTGSSHKAGGDDKLVLQQQGLSAANWSGWESFGAEASMGGPLAEALRSSSNPSPTTVLLKPMSSISNTNSISS